MRTAGIARDPSGTRSPRRDHPPGVPVAETVLTMDRRRDTETDLPVAFAAARPQLKHGWTARRVAVRRYADLAGVAAVAPGRSWRRVQYWSFVDVARDEDRDLLDALSIEYDVTIIAPRPMGWERPKTHGHIHIRPAEPGAGFAEVYQVLAGKAGFLFQDLGPGPSSHEAVLVEAAAGDAVVIPPQRYHVTINLGSTVLVVADAICRASEDEYSALRAAHGMAFLLAMSGDVVPNPSYRNVPELRRIEAREWSAGPPDLYRSLARKRDSLAWLCG